MAKVWNILKESYRDERERSKSAVSIAQKDFLPAALEILETPASPVGRAIIWAICSFFLIALIWSIVGKVDVVAVARGKIVPHGQTKIVQSFEHGVVQNLVVENGSQVNKGDVLIELDSTRNQADIARLERDLQAASLSVGRNQWLLENLNQLIPSDFELSHAISSEEKQIQRLFGLSQLEEYRATQQAYSEQIKERRTQVLLSQTELEKLQQTLPLLEEQVDGLKQLSSEGVAPRFRYLEYQESLVSRHKDILIEQDRIKQISASIESLIKQQRQHEYEYRAERVRELTEANDSKESIKQELIKAREAQTLHQIRAPVNGVVQQLKIHTIGGVIRSGDPLMAIVPAEEHLQVEAAILNKDIGFVHVGQPVQLKIETFPFTKYGTIDGEVLSIDRDAVQDEDQGLVYPARISMAEQSIMANGKSVLLNAGMGLNAEIKIGKRQLIEFILSPLFRYRSESLRER